MIPQAVVFDLGKVLVDFDYSIAIRKIQSRCRVSLEEVRELIDQSPLLFRYETNLLTTAQFFSEVQSVAGFRGELAEFGEMFGDIFTPIEPMVQLHAALRSRSVPTYIFSNTNELAVANIRRNYPFFGRFDDYVLSYEHGAMKPDEKLYEVVERVSGLKKRELLYIDDRPENIAAGAKRGWQAIFHQSPEVTLAGVRKAGLLAHS